MVEIHRLIVVGYGNMGRAIARRLPVGVAAQPAGPVLRIGRLLVVDPHREDPHASAEPVNVADRLSTTQDLARLDEGDALLLAVKPQVFDSIAPDLRRLLHGARPGPVPVLSVMAGVTCGHMRRELGDNAAVIRAMPNLAAAIGMSASAFCLGPGSSPQHADFARGVLQTIGSCVIELPEQQIDPFTAVAGSGPAYVFFLAQAMIEGAVAAGIDPQTADAAVRQTIAGAAALLSRDRTAPEALRASVTSKGGTTEAAVGVLEDRRVREAVIAAITAARARAGELSR